MVIFPESATLLLTVIILKYGFVGKRCIRRSHLISLISSTCYRVTEFGGSHFKKIAFLTTEQKIQLESSLAVRLGTLVFFG